MKYLLFLLVTLLCSFALAAQPTPLSPALRSLQGHYEYLNHTTLHMAASPRDGQLYAVIGDSRYLLRAAGADRFVNASGDTVHFERDATGQVQAYTVSKQRFRVLARGSDYPVSMWYPRLLAAGQPFSYRYHAPPPRADGLPVGALTGTGLDPALLATMVTKIVDGTYPNIHSVLILHDGKLVFEEYFYDYDRERLHPLRSATKSFISALTGVSVAQGLVPTVQAPVVPYFSEYSLRNNSPGKQAITVENLLTNQSGLDCDITEPQSPGDETKMDASRDWVRFTLDLPLRDPPGTVGRYCSGNPITLGRLVEKRAQQPLAEYARQYLFAPLGITQFEWRFQPDSSSVETFCQLSLRPRDQAKFGQLYLDGGRWHGRQVLPAAWVAASLTKHAVIQNVNYGYLWWLKHLDVNGTRFEGAMAQGNGGQRIAIWPAQHLVVVVNGGNYNQASPSDVLIATYILAAFAPKSRS